MVNSIIRSPNQTKPSPVYVHDFNEKFKEHFKEDFKTISGVDISRFADKNSHIFETSVDKRHRKMIQAKAKKVSKKKRHKKEIPNELNQSGKSDDLYETDYVTAESDQLTEETSDEDSTDELSGETFLESNKERPNLKLSLSDSDDYDKDLILQNHPGKNGQKYDGREIEHQFPVTQGLINLKISNRNIRKFKYNIKERFQRKNSNIY